jgi:signal peptidase II
MADVTDRTPGRRSFWGRWTALGLAVAAMTCALDQAAKLWLLFVFGLADRGTVPLTPFLALALTWNTGISYGLFPQDSAVGQWVLLGIKAAVVVLLLVWLGRAGSRLTAIALGLIVGGAVGNAIDRVAYGAVVDFILLHLTTAGFSFQWYVFNVADAAIVAGVAGLLYESLRGERAAKAPRSGL